MITRLELLKEIDLRRRARVNLHDYIRYTSPHFKISGFSEAVCRALDKFIRDVVAGSRPVLVLKAPPQHGKSEMVSRKLPAFLMSAFDEMRIGTASYSSDLANDMAQWVRRNLASSKHKRLFPNTKPKDKFDRSTMGLFNSPYGVGSYIGVGIGTGLTGRPVDIGIIDDPTKDQKEALSEVTKETHWNWYQAVFLTRLSENSGQIIMATSWAEDDLPGRIEAMYNTNDRRHRMTVLRFPALNFPNETGYNPRLPQGALVPDLKSEAFLREAKSVASEFWWSALYQQSPHPMGGSIFKNTGIQFYLPKMLPKSFDLIIDSWDCAFKDTDGSDYVVGQKWGKRGAYCYLLHQIRGQMGFTETARQVELLRNWNGLIAREVLIEDKANGPAVIDFLKMKMFGLIPVEPDGSKTARAHAVTSVWEALNVWLPHPDVCPWIGAANGQHLPGTWLAEITRFSGPGSTANDDQVDSFTQALRRLYPLFGRLAISGAAMARASGSVR